MLGPQRRGGGRDRCRRLPLGGHHPQKELHIAPMLDVSTREFRYLMRLLTQSAVLWTEMVVDETLVHGRDPHWHLSLQQSHEGIDERPIICQVGGNRPEYAGIVTRLVRQHGYDGIDLNCECPSHKVASDRVFGAALMKDPSIAVRMISAIQKAADELEEVSASSNHSSTQRRELLVSVKMRIGVDDDMDSYPELRAFVQKLVPHCRRFVVHARKVYTQGLNPDQNRRIPPLNYSVVYRLCRDFPTCDFILNGGIETLQQAKALLFGTDFVKRQQPTQELQDDGLEREDDDNDDIPPIRGEQDCNDDDDDDDEDNYAYATDSHHTAPLRRAPPNLVGVMMGRAARDDPLQFWDADRYLFGHERAGAVVRTRRQLFDLYSSYLEAVYPRRCCDDDPQVTVTYPSPNVQHHSPHCPACRRTTVNDSLSPSPPPPPPTPIKVTSHVIDRSFKPVWGALHNQPGSRRYRSRLFELGRTLSLRNCGPAYLLRRAVRETVPDELLDRPLDECG